VTCHPYTEFVVGQGARGGVTEECGDVRSRAVVRRMSGGDDAACVGLGVLKDGVVVCILVAPKLAH